ncbi:MAG TPA: bifunctional phosphoribosyl-AMP cyclohydrolase/phosphoribosyl-ATP diphosphatase HisIE [Candidatus Thermoplasmatota archaeon]|nr:bifunctional phosphoribosyl-AMP cyclohydrolase/phosphoribosyl-ATP diphosphatase HisIE [Candidatus Thermoplasmatota archaeon]
MTKRKVRVAGKSGRTKKSSRSHAKPAVHKYSKPKPGHKDAEAAPEPPQGTPKAPPKGMAARLAAMAAASAAMQDEPEMARPRPGPPMVDPFGEVDEPPRPGPAHPPSPEDLGPGSRGTHAGGHAPPAPSLPSTPRGAPSPAPAAPAPSPAPAEPDGIQVVAKGPSKFSLEDLELLKSAIKVKGGGQVVEGINFEELKWDAEGLIPVVAQDRRTGAVLMLAHTNKETLEQTLRTKNMTYWSRSRNKVWVKGEESGHTQRMVRIEVDCDKDAILATVDQEGPACHRDTGTCWTDARAIPLGGFLGELDRLIADTAKNPRPDSHTSKLLAEPIEALKKFVEEANEVTRVLQGKPNKDPLEHEAADVLYHLLVACRTKGVGLERIVTELYARHMADQVKR